MKLLLFLLLLLLSVTGCQKTTALEAPPEILYGQDICDECSMIINEARFAASYVTTTGDVRRFDDIGGMLAHDAKTAEDVHIYWVHDFISETWLDAEKAAFVLDSGVNSPMGWGVVAFADQERARTYIAEHGGILTSFVVLQAEIKAGSIDPVSLSGHVHDDH